MPILSQTVAGAARALEARGNPEARLEAEVLAMHAMGLTKAGLYSRWADATDTGKCEALETLVARRLRGEPLVYITGHREFYGLDFQVDRRVLIPRPETEHLVEAALAWLHEAAGPRSVADIGTGSGNIAVSLAVHDPEAHVTATDSSAGALEVARNNAARHGVAGRILFLQGDLLAPFADKTRGSHPTSAGPRPGEPAGAPFDLMLANLPYVRQSLLPAWCGAAQVELTWEPYDALDGGPDGLDVIRRFLVHAPAHLRPGGAVFVEIAWDQGPHVRELAEQAFPGAAVTVDKDLAGRDRIVAILSAHRPRRLMDLGGR